MERYFFPEQQKEWRSRSQITKDQLSIEKIHIKELQEIKGLSQDNIVKVPKVLGYDATQFTVEC